MACGQTLLLSWGVRFPRRDSEHHPCGVLVDLGQQESSGLRVGHAPRPGWVPSGGNHEKGPKGDMAVCPV